MPIQTDLFEKARTHERLEQLSAAREHDLLPSISTTGPGSPSTSRK